MNTSSDIKNEKPNIVQALLAGFNTIANKPYLILLPVFLDLFLWFGPGWRVDGFFKPFLQNLVNLPGLDTPESAGLLVSFQSSLQEVLGNFNLATTLRTFPIGLPSLMISKPSFLNPLGQSAIFSLETSSQILGIWLIFAVIGLALGSVYFQLISKQVNIQGEQANQKSFWHSFLQAILMPVLLVLILLILAIPLLFLITLFSMISPGISEFVIMIAFVVILWIIMPLIFTPHGVFLYHQNLIAAMMNSISVVRVSMSRTSWFILASYVLISGLDYLWSSPGVDNWLLLVGIMGHAFIVSAVIAASFHYFKDATRFTQTLLENNLKPSTTMPFKNQE